jgi:hypothetical protein
MNQNPHAEMITKKGKNIFLVFLLNIWVVVFREHSRRGHTRTISFELKIEQRCAQNGSSDENRSYDTLSHKKGGKISLFVFDGFPFTFLRQTYARKTFDT